MNNEVHIILNVTESRRKDDGGDGPAVPTGREISKEIEKQLTETYKVNRIEDSNYEEIERIKASRDGKRTNRIDRTWERAFLDAGYDENVLGQVKTLIALQNDLGRNDAARHDSGGDFRMQEKRGVRDEGPQDIHVRSSAQESRVADGRMDFDCGACCGCPNRVEVALAILCAAALPLLLLIIAFIMLLSVQEGDAFGRMLGIIREYEVISGPAAILLGAIFVQLIRSLWKFCFYGRQ